MRLKFRWETEFKETPIGKIPKEWEVRRLEDIAKISSGGTPSRKKKEYWNGDINWVKSQEVRAQFIWKTEEKITEAGMKNSTAKQIYPPNTVLIALYGATAGEIAILKIPATINQAIAALEAKHVEDLFLFYSLTGNKKRLKESPIGSAQQNLYLRDIKQFTIPIPPTKEEQERIATVLSWFDDLIENKRKQNEILEKTAMAIFKSWFIDFEPFQDGEFVYSEELDMEIPKGWEVKPIEDVVNFRYGKGLPERKRMQGPYPVVGSSGIVGYHNKYLTKGPTLVIGRKGNAGSIQLILEPNYPIDTVFFSDDDTPAETVFYLYHYLKVRSLQSMADSDTAVPGLSINLLNLFEVVMPPKPILRRFHSLVEPLFRKIIINEKEIMVLKKARDTLLPQLVFGRLRVEEI